MTESESKSIFRAHLHTKSLRVDSPIYRSNRNQLLLLPEKAGSETRADIRSAFLTDDEK